MLTVADKNIMSALIKEHFGVDSPIVFSDRAKGINKSNHFMVTLKNEERFSFKVSNDISAKREYTISKVAKMLSFKVIQNVKLVNFPTALSKIGGQLGIIIHWEKDATTLADARYGDDDSYKKATRHKRFAFAAGAIAFFIRLFNIGDRHGYNFVFNPHKKHLVMIDCEFAFERVPDLSFERKVVNEIAHRDYFEKGYARASTLYQSKRNKIDNFVKKNIGYEEFVYGPLAQPAEAPFSKVEVQLFLFCF